MQLSGYQLWQVAVDEGFGGVIGIDSPVGIAVAAVVNTVSWAGWGDIDYPEVRALPTGHSVWVVMQRRAFFVD